MTIEKIWFPIVTTRLSTLYPSDNIIMSSLTLLHGVTLLSISAISVVWDKRLFPISFDFLSKLGSSNFDKQT